MKATDTQIGGNHYKQFAIQPIEFCMKNGLNACQTNIVKYICRYKHKNGKEDLLKALHYVELLVQFYENGIEEKQTKGIIPITVFEQDNSMTEIQGKIIYCACFNRLEKAKDLITNLIQKEYPDAD